LAPSKNKANLGISFSGSDGSVIDSQSRKLTQLPRIGNAVNTTIALVPSSTNDTVERLVWTKSGQQSYYASGPPDLFVPAIIERQRASIKRIGYSEKHSSMNEKTSRKRKWYLDLIEYSSGDEDV
jgi:hypothetical protein